MVKLCSINDCNQTVMARGWCSKHYSRWKATGDPLLARQYIRGGRTCTKENCTEPTEARDLCHKHYQRWKYRQNPEKFREWEQRRRSKSEAVRQRDRERYQENPLPKLLASKRRKARVRGASGSHTPEEWLDLLQRFDGRCAYCGAQATTEDHVVAIAKGGSDYIENILPACFPCNASKGARSLAEWIPSRPSPLIADLLSTM